MNGQQLYDNYLTKILRDTQIDVDYAVVLFNLARNYIENKRPWRKLVSKDLTQIRSSSDTWLTAKTIPADFRRYLKDGKMNLFDGANDKQTLFEVPFERMLDFKDYADKFWADYKNNQFYIGGTTNKNYTIYQFYIAASPDISLTTSWANFPTEYHPVLAYEAAARWRLGSDYDDLAARNADDNAKTSDRIMESMFEWDNEIQVGSVENLDRGQHGRGFRSGRLDANNRWDSDE